MIVWWILCERGKRKRPRVLEPEGVRVASGDRGDRSPRWRRISRCWWCRRNSACCFRAAAHRAVRTRTVAHRAWAMSDRRRCGRRGSWNSRVEESPVGEGRAPYAHVFRLATNFLHRRRAARFTGSKAACGRCVSRRANVSGTSLRCGHGLASRKKKKPAVRRVSLEELDPRLRGGDVPARHSRDARMGHHIT